MHSEDPEAQIPMWGYVLTAFGILLVTVGAMIGLFRPEMLIAANAEISEGVRIYAGYMVARNLAIAVMLVVLGIARVRRSLALMFVFIGVVQIFDAVIDMWERRWPIVPGVLLLAIVFMIGGYKLSRVAVNQRTSRSSW